jgi:hypothetical protein
MSFLRPVFSDTVLDELPLRLYMARRSVVLNTNFVVSVCQSSYDIWKRGEVLYD